MNTVPVPWFFTPGQKGNQLADTLDSYVNSFPFGRAFSGNTFYAPNASVRYDADGRTSNRNAFFNDGDSIDNSGLYDEDPASRALRLARDGTSREWACNQMSPFSAPFRKIELQQQVQLDYYWAGCIPATRVLVIFFLLLYLGVTFGAVAYYINYLPNPCSAIIMGALLEWDHSQRLATPVVVAPPVAPVVPPTSTAFYATAVAPPIPTVSRSTVPTTVEQPPTAFALLLSNIFGSGASNNGPATYESRPTSSGTVAASCDLTTASSIGNVCASQWSVPSAEWVQADPVAANFVFRGCGAVCVKPNTLLPSFGNQGICTCDTPISLRR